MFGRKRSTSRSKRRMPVTVSGGQPAGSQPVSNTVTFPSVRARRAAGRDVGGDLRKTELPDQADNIGRRNQVPMPGQQRFVEFMQRGEIGDKGPLAIRADDADEIRSARRDLDTVQGNAVAPKSSRICRPNASAPTLAMTLTGTPKRARAMARYPACPDEAAT